MPHIDKRIQVNTIIENQLPEFVVSDFPNAIEFFKQYYISQEFQGGASDIINNFDHYLKVDNLVPEVVVGLTTITADVSSSDTTITVPSTKGFPSEYGLLKINDEIISYTGITTNTFTDTDLEWDTEYFYRVSANVGYYTDYSNTVSLTLESLDIKNSSNLPESFIVHQNFPNPFNPVTTLSYQLPNEGNVQVVIYDMAGRVVKNLILEHQSAGHKTIKWNATNNSGHPVSAGLYIYTVSTRDLKQSRKMLFLK